MSLEVGTNLKYAGYANDDHMTLDPSKNHFILPNGEMARFVPGYWNGNRFVYDKTANGGMVLKFHKVEGLHFWESAINIMEKTYPDMLEAKLQEWLDKYFDG